MTDAPAKTTISITVDGKSIEANKGELVIAAAERHGVHIPRFCYHPRMREVGMCRMCLVEIDTGRGPALQPACMIPVAENMTVDTQSDKTKKAQDGVLEFLLINHPLDCPVCDKGGECPLQDNTVAFGPGESRFVEEKRHYEKPIPISDLVFLDRERCILCDRCTRFAKEVAGDPLIHFVNRGARTEVNTFPDEPFSSYFSGNTVQICPVGALTAKPYRFRARPWDLEEVESTCTTCSVGCSVTVQSSRNKLLRYQGVDSDAVNWSWLCDRGRFSFEAVNSEDRLTEPLVRTTGGDGFQTARWNDALASAAKAIRAAKDTKGGGSIAVLGGARLTNEAAYAWAKLAKGIIGTDHVDCQMGDGLPAPYLLGLQRATIAEACQPGGTIVLIGPDAKEELPVLYLRLRHAVVEDRAKLYEVGLGGTGLTKHAKKAWHGLAGQLPELAAQLVAEVDLSGPVTVVVGRTSLTEDPAGIQAAVAIVAKAAPHASYLPALPRGNVFGALDAGLAPGLLPGRISLDDGRKVFTEAWGSVPADPGADATEILALAAAGKLEVLVMLGADPLADYPDRALAAKALAAVPTIVAVDTFLTGSSETAHIVLPAAAFGEVDGTTTNLEGRVLPVAQKVTAPGTARPDWMIAAELATRLDADLGFTSQDELWDEYESLSAPHAGLRSRLASPDGQDGVIVIGGSFTTDPAAALPPVTPGLAPAALRLVVTTKLYDGAVGTSRSPSLAPLAPKAAARLHPNDLAVLGVGEGTILQLTSEAGTLALPVQADSAVVPGSVAITANLPDAPLGTLLRSGAAITDVTVDTRTA